MTHPLPSSLSSVSAAPYRSRSVVNLHHQDTETDEATMVLPPEDYCDTPQRSAVKSNTPSAAHVTSNSHQQQHQHSPTPSAASSLSSEHNTVRFFVFSVLSSGVLKLGQVGGGWRVGCRDAERGFKAHF